MAEAWQWLFLPGLTVFIRVLFFSEVTFLITVTIYLTWFKEERVFICLWMQKCQAIVHSYDSGSTVKEKMTASRSCGEGVICFMEDRKRDMF